MNLGLNALDTFAWVGAFSAAVTEDGTLNAAIADVAHTNQLRELLGIACGKDDFLPGENEKLTARLKEKTVNHEWHLTKGDHSWPIWRGYLADFAPRLFR